MRHLSVFSWLLLVAMIAACGGGGGSGGGGGGGGTVGGVTYAGLTTQARLTTDNANKFFSLMWNGAGSSGLTTNTLAVAKPASSTAAGTANLVKTLARTISAKGSGSAAQKRAKSSVSVATTIPGSVSGTLTLIGTIDNATGLGSLAMTLTNYNDGGGYTYNGGATMLVTGYNPFYDTLTDATMTFTALYVKTAGSDAVLNGSIRRQESVQDGSQVVTVNLDGRDNVANETFRFANFAVTDRYGPATPGWAGTESYSGRVYAAKFGYVEISSAAPCIYAAASDLNPSSGGPILFGGSSGSRARISPVSTTNVLIEVDANGDGGYEGKNGYSWSSLSGPPVAVVTSITVQPANAKLGIGSTLQLTATGTLSDNTVQDVTTSVTWSSSTGNAAVSSTGMVTALITGTATVTATSGSITGSTTLTITPPVLATIEVTPGTPSLPKASTQNFTATGIYTDQSRQDVTATATWSSSNSAVATFDGTALNGQLLGVGHGTATITATVGSVAGNTSVRVANWTQRGGGQSYTLRGVAWSGNLFVAVGDDLFTGPVILTSPDGVSWTPRDAGFGNNGYGYTLEAVAWSGSKFIAVGTSTILTSADGISWSQLPAGTMPGFGTGIACSSSLCVASGYGIILTSPDAVTWTSQDAGVQYESLYSVSWSGSQFLVVGHGVNVTSPDGATWTTRTGIFHLASAVWSGTQYVAVGMGSGFNTSPDGITWTLRSSENAFAVTWGANQYVAVGGQLNAQIFTSPDGISWSTDSFLSMPQLANVVWSPNGLVAVGVAGTILTSP